MKKRIVIIRSLNSYTGMNIMAQEKKAKFKRWKTIEYFGGLKGALRWLNSK